MAGLEGAHPCCRLAAPTSSGCPQPLSLKWPKDQILNEQLLWSRQTAQAQSHQCVLIDECNRGDSCTGCWDDLSPQAPVPWREHSLPGFNNSMSSLTCWLPNTCKLLTYLPWRLCAAPWILCQHSALEAKQDISTATAMHHVCNLHHSTAHLFVTIWKITSSLHCNHCTDTHCTFSASGTHSLLKER